MILRVRDAGGRWWVTVRYDTILYSMPIDIENLRRYYDSLSDEALLEVDRAELVEAARNCYDQELANRGLGEPEREDPIEPAVRRTPRERAENLDFDTGGTPDWLDDAACACTFESSGGSHCADDAAHARDILLTAGIPCHISTVELEGPSTGSQRCCEYRVMVPGALSLQATSELDKEIFNAQVEAEWRIHFEALSDEQLHALHWEVICGGLLDRIKRLKRAYDEEIARRNN